MIFHHIAAALMVIGAAATAQSADRTLPSTVMQGSSLYPRIVRIAHGPAETRGHLLASTNHTIFRSTDDGRTWQFVTDITAIEGSHTRCCTALYEVPEDVGELKAGTLLFSGTFTEGNSAAVQVYVSADEGRTWKYHSTPVKRGGAPHHGLWEPDFLLAKDGSLVIFWSDETDPCCSQKLAQMRTTDGVTWKDETDTVRHKAQSERPGMIVTATLPDGRYFMSYEVCGPIDHCWVYSRMSKDGWNWGDSEDMGTKVVTTTGQYLAHAPNNRYMPDGHILLIGQMVFDADGRLSKDNGIVTLVSDPKNPLKPWTTVRAPVPIPAAFDSPCPNYSSAMLPTQDNKYFMELASDFLRSGSRGGCTVYYGIQPLPAR